MMGGFAGLSVMLLAALIWQRIQYIKLKKEVDYISNRVENLSIISENGFVLLPTENICIRKLERPSTRYSRISMQKSWNLSIRKK